MKKNLIFIAKLISIFSVFAIGLFVSQILLKIKSIWGSTTKICTADWLISIDQKNLHSLESCFGLCCDQILIYLLYLAIFAPISFFLFSKKQKLPAILFTAFGVGIILGTFVFFLIMP